jgi:anaerobic magnesium-protoporphyrin IX monomethyl ester cyclase
MKITLVQPYYFNIWEALGLAYIGAYAKKRFPGKLKMTFYQGYFDSDNTIIEDGKSSDIVAFSCTSPVFRPAVKLASAIKAVNPKVRTVFGGFHPTAVPNDCLEEDVVDQVIVREGEEGFLKVLEGDTSPIIYGERFADFEDIFPDRDLIRNDRTVDLCQELIGKRVASLQSVRVCPFRCAFCAERKVTGVFNPKTNPLRVRDPKHLLEEIKWLAREYSLDYFKFADATWNTSTEKVIAFCEEKIRQRVDLAWEANVHAAFADKEMLRAMKAAGCIQINVGCESGSQEILNDMRKGVAVEKIKKVFQWGREIGIERRGYFLLGMPNETVEDIRLTEKLVDEIQPDIFGITILCPYPGCDFYDPATMKRYDWTFADEYSNPYWHTKYFSNAELKKWQKYLTDKFSSSLSWHNKLLKEGRDH